MKLARETWILLAIGIADLTSTIFFIRQHGASEANPIFRHYWNMGLPPFIAAKMALMIGPLMILEWARRQKPQMVARALRCAIAGYILMYGVGVARLNTPPALASALTRREPEEGFPPASKEEINRLLERFHRIGKNIPPAPYLPVSEEDGAD